jgi:hypothetical protein
MLTFVKNLKVATAAAAVFGFAVVLNFSIDARSNINGNPCLTSLESELVAHGPSLPPDPWEPVRLAHGPSLPPDPWEPVRLAHGPSLPPDPWEPVRLAHGPSLPPDPWEPVRAA